MVGAVHLIRTIPTIINQITDFGILHADIVGAKEEFVCVSSCLSGNKCKVVVVHQSVNSMFKLIFARIVFD